MRNPNEAVARANKSSSKKVATPPAQIHHGPAIEIARAVTARRNRIAAALYVSILLVLAGVIVLALAARGSFE